MKMNDDTLYNMMVEYYSLENQRILAGMFYTSYANSLSADDPKDTAQKQFAYENTMKQLEVRLELLKTRIQLYKLEKEKFFGIF
jgi:hypothetical protein